MESLVFIPTEAISPSSNPKDGDNIRPGSSKPWKSAPKEKLPSVEVKFPRKKSPIIKVDLPELKNVKAVKLTFTPENKAVNKV